MAPSDLARPSFANPPHRIAVATAATAGGRVREHAGAEQLRSVDGCSESGICKAASTHRDSANLADGSFSRDSSLRRPFERRKTQSGIFDRQCGAVLTARLPGTETRRARLLDTVNRLIRRGTERVPLGGVPFGGALLGRDDISRGQELLDEEFVAEEDGTPQLDPGRFKKVLILMSDTGGGHRASAEAIKATFELEFGDEYKVTIIDLWKDYTPWPFNQVPKTYSFMVKHEALWKLAYHSTAPRFVHQSQMAATSTFIARQVMKGLLKYQPDVIVSVHPLMQHVPLRILRAKGLLDKIPFTTVITDLSTCHPTWFHRSVTKCFCPTKDVEQRALKAGLRPSQLSVYGLPIRPAFSRATRPKAELQKELELVDDLPTVLLIGGGEGMGPVEETAHALLESLYDKASGQPIGQLVVICGRNKKLVKKLDSFNWKIPIKAVGLWLYSGVAMIDAAYTLDCGYERLGVVMGTDMEIIQGFVTNMAEWMGASDCVITKAGPGTIAEALICGLPMVLNSYIAGQEVGNVSFVVENAAGKFSDKPAEIASIVANWFGSKATEFKEMAQNAAKLGRPDAVFKIVHDIDELARYRKTLDRHKLSYV